MFGSASTAPELETKFLASLAPPMLARVVPEKINSPDHRRARAVSAVRKIFSSKKFSRVVVYCSVIKVPVVLFLRQL